MADGFDIDGSNLADEVVIRLADPEDTQPIPVIEVELNQPDEIEPDEVSR